jgi:hypothetical protein
VFVISEHRLRSAITPASRANSGRAFPQPADYIGVKVEGPFKPDHYRH